MNFFHFFIGSLIAAFGAQAQTSSASWQFPIFEPGNDGLIMNNIDAILLQWTSNYDEAWLEMWCQKDGSAAGGDQNLGIYFISLSIAAGAPYVLDNC